MHFSEGVTPLATLVALPLLPLLPLPPLPSPPLPLLCDRDSAPVTSQNIHLLTGLASQLRFAFK